MTTEQTQDKPAHDPDASVEQVVGTLVEWAQLFEPLHQSILKTGGASCCEYDQIWHDYKSKVRPIIDHFNAEAGRTSDKASSDEGVVGTKGENL
jgi:hypothetical protein